MTKLTILGCGNSAGTPAMGNYWGACDPKEPKNNRTRASIAVRSETMTLLIDTSPDLRLQANREGISQIDAIIFTHNHSDHVHGIDEIRNLNQRLGGMITPIYATAETMADIHQRFGYLFFEHEKIYPAVLMPNILMPETMNRPITIGDITLTPFLQDHGTCISLGFRFGDVAYSTDMVRLPPESIETLKGVKTWIVDAAGYKMERNIVHSTLQNVFDLNKEIKAEQVYLTHMGPNMDYQTLLKELPEGYKPAYDGLEIEL
jgi:phosphoribosyl 1,2-cyclic phosphate phosphodiesterase